MLLRMQKQGLVLNSAVASRINSAATSGGFGSGNSRARSAGLASTRPTSSRKENQVVDLPPRAIVADDANFAAASVPDVLPLEWVTAGMASKSQENWQGNAGKTAHSFSPAGEEDVISLGAPAVQGGMPKTKTNVISSEEVSLNRFVPPDGMGCGPVEAAGPREIEALPAKFGREYRGLRGAGAVELVAGATELGDEGALDVRNLSQGRALPDRQEDSYSEAALRALREANSRSLGRDGVEGAISRQSDIERNSFDAGPPNPVAEGSAEEISIHTERSEITSDAIPSVAQNPLDKGLLHAAVENGPYITSIGLIAPSPPQHGSGALDANLGEPPRHSLNPTSPQSGPISKEASEPVTSGSAPVGLEYEQRIRVSAEMHKEWRPEVKPTGGNPSTAPIPGRKKLAELGGQAGLSSMTAATVDTGTTPSAVHGAASRVEQIQAGGRAVGEGYGPHEAGSFDPFNAIDRGTPAVRATVAATQRSLSVGYQDPVLGYVELRAGVKSDGLHATLTTVTEGARDSLGAQMSGLREWMITRHIPLTSLGVMASGAVAESGFADRLESRPGGGVVSIPVRGPARARRCIRVLESSRIIAQGGTRSLAEVGIREEALLQLARPELHLWLGWWYRRPSIERSRVGAEAESRLWLDRSRAGKTIEREGEMGMVSLWTQREGGTGLMTAASAPTGKAAANAASSSSATIGANDFLTLLVTEMRNQDPTASTDPNAYVNQLVSINSLEQLISINQNLSTALGTGSSSGNTSGAAGGSTGQVVGSRGLVGAASGRPGHVTAGSGISGVPARRVLDSEAPGFATPYGNRMASAAARVGHALARKDAGLPESKALRDIPTHAP